MTKNKEWTQEEEAVLKYQVVRNATMAEAFKKASEILETRTVLACKNHWYREMLPSFIPLQDRIAVSQPKEHYSMWDRIKAFFKRVL